VTVVSGVVMRLCYQSGTPMPRAMPIRVRQPGADYLRRRTSPTEAVT
jgi:hypothetical protein